MFPHGSTKFLIIMITSIKDVVYSMWRCRQVTVIAGETGSGKTTQVPQFVLDQFLEDESRKNCFVICTQPRRISAITVAER